MKRVGNKPAQLVRSASRRRKASSRFQFDITIDKVFGTKPNFSYYVKWSRGVKVAQTKPVPCSKETSGKSGLPIQQKLSLMVTLYREEGKKFDPKDAKISLIAVNPVRKQERTAAKFHFDLSAFAGVPTASTTKIFKLSDKFSIRATVDARFVKAGASGPGSAGASSALSALSGVSARSSDDDDDNNADDDFGDLALDDVPEPEVLGASSAKSRKAPPLAKAQPPPAPPVPSKAPIVPAASHAAPPSQPAASRAVPPSQPKALSSVQEPRVPLIIESANPTAASAMTERQKPPTPPPSTSVAPSTPPRTSPRTSSASPPTTASSPKRGYSPLARFKRDKSLPIPGAATSKLTSVARPEDEAEIARLSKENERLFTDVKRAREESRVLRDSHRGEIEKLSSELKAQKRESSASASERASLDSSAAALKSHNRELEEKVKVLTRELEDVKLNRDSLTKQNKSLANVDERNLELSREVDRLTIAAAKGSGSQSSKDTSEFESRLLQVQKEKEALKEKVKKHEIHSTKIRQTYQKLTQMYDDLREHNSALQSELEEVKANGGNRSSSEAGEKDDLMQELEEARQDVCDMEADKDALQSDHDRLLSQVNSLQDRLDNTSQLLEESQREVEDLYEETQELKGQRDMAMQRALSRGKNTPGSEDTESPALAKAQEELRSAKEKHEREQTRLGRRVAELEQEIGDLREDIEYEKAEKNKARTERDNFRNTARTLERKTSLAAKQSDAMNSLQRQVSTHQMREQDHESMIGDLKSEVIRLEAELSEARIALNDRRSSNAEEIEEVVQKLISTKVALAEAEDDKLKLQFSLKELKKTEKGIQQRLAAHASRLEVKLGEANEELERLRKQRQLADASEFNELGSDVDY